MSETIKELDYTPDTPLQKGVNKFIDWYIDFYNIKEEKKRDKK